MASLAYGHKDDGPGGTSPTTQELFPFTFKPLLLALCQAS